MHYYLVIDTNVLVSAALKHHSVPGSIVDLAFDGPVTPVLSTEIENEYREVLSRPKFHLTQDIVDDIIHAFQQRGLYLDAEHLEMQLPDPSDLIFYEVVLGSRKERETYLVTGNIRHFPVRPYVVSPRQMLDIILNEWSGE